MRLYWLPYTGRAMTAGPLTKGGSHFDFMQVFSSWRVMQFQNSIASNIEILTLKLGIHQKLSYYTALYTLYKEKNVAEQSADGLGFSSGSARLPLTTVILTDV